MRVLIIGPIYLLLFITEFSCEHDEESTFPLHMPSVQPLVVSEFFFVIMIISMLLSIFVACAQRHGDAIAFSISLENSDEMRSFSDRIF